MLYVWLPHSLFSTYLKIEYSHPTPARLQAHPDFHQADHLKGKVDDQIMKEGVMGVSIGAAVLGVGLAVLFGSSRK